MLAFKKGILMYATICKTPRWVSGAQLRKDLRGVMLNYKSRVLSKKLLEAGWLHLNLTQLRSTYNGS
jgi:hypothetical protein